MEPHPTIKSDTNVRVKQTESDPGDKPRWIIEESQSEQSSDFYSSNDEEAAHMRHDGNSSAEEENKFKDYIRRQAREEHDQAKVAKEQVKQREIDMKRIEELKFNKETIPEDL